MPTDLCGSENGDLAGTSSVPVGPASQRRSPHPHPLPEHAAPDPPAIPPLLPLPADPCAPALPRYCTPRRVSAYCCWRGRPLLPSCLPLCPRRLGGRHCDAEVCTCRPGGIEAPARPEGTLPPAGPTILFLPRGCGKVPPDRRASGNRLELTGTWLCGASSSGPVLVLVLAVPLSASASVRWS